MHIAKVGVVGAGSMGSGIAALAASTGLRVVLLDIPGERDRDKIVRDSLARALKAKPSPFLDSTRVSLIEVGNTEDDIDLLGDCDWILEAIIEQPGPKQELFARVEAIAPPHAIISSNTSGIPIHSLSEGRGDSFRRRFLGTHFFNPPRFLHLLELIPTPQTDPAVVATMRRFAERTLGKGVVIAKDVPGFIGNRIGLFAVVRAMRLMERYDLGIDEVDALTGPLIGRPKSATFRTADITGIDLLVHVAAEMGVATGEDFSVPEWIHKLTATGRRGEKSGAGFYRKDKSGIQTINTRTLDYEPQCVPDLGELGKLVELPLGQRLAAITKAQGKYADFLRDLLVDTSHYTIDKAPELAHDITSVDRAMEWGYGWEAGPFRQMNDMGLDFLRASFTRAGLPTPPLMALAHEAFHRQLNSGSRQLSLSGSYAPIEQIPEYLDLAAIRSAGGLVDSNDGAALLNLGDGVLLLEFRAKMNTMGPQVFELLERAERLIRANGYVGLVIGNADPRTFTAGANLSIVSQRAKAGEFEALDKAVRAFQQGVLSIRRAPFPVVVAPFGLTLGGGTELMLHADVVQAHAELYSGLVEVGVGLIPAGGGTKELLFRFARELVPYEEADPFEAVRRAFKLISTAATSGSAFEARALGLLRDKDRISMNRDRLLSDAKRRVLDLAPDYAPPIPYSVRAMGREALGNLEYAVWSMREGNYISDHDVVIGKKLARVLCGGDGPARDVNEDDLLDLEREAFLSLVGMQQTQERIDYMLRTGKPLRN